MMVFLFIISNDIEVKKVQARNR